ncbi:PrpF domain-containing protein [Chromobacterium vaccinii]
MKPPSPTLRPYRAFGIWHYPVHLMRGGTSSGLVLPGALIPEEPALRDELLRHLMGVPLHGELPGNKQLTGLGRGTPTSNKVFLVDQEEADGQFRLISTLAQLAAHTDAIDWRVNCGNLSSALPLWALDMGWLNPDADGLCRIRIRNTNTGVISDASMSMEADQRLRSAAIPGVEGLWPEVHLYLNHPVGAKTGQLLPTGSARDVIDGVEVSCVDVAVPMVLIRAADLGKTAQESPADLQSDPDFMAALRRLWVKAALKMRLRDASGRLLDERELALSETLPKVAILAPGHGEARLCVRYFTPQQAHASLAVSGACCIASACLVPGTIAHELAAMELPAQNDDFRTEIALANPAGLLRARVEAEMDGMRIDILRVAYQRNTQILQRGHVPLYRASAALAAALARIQ